MWFPALLQLMIQKPVRFNSSHLILPGANQKHPQSPKMKLMAVLYSNSTSTRVSEDTNKILSAAWRESTTTKCVSIINRFTEFCGQKQISTHPADTSIIFEFLSTTEFGRGLKYSALRGTLSAIAKVTTSEDDALFKNVHERSLQFETTYSKVSCNIGY